MNITFERIALAVLVVVVIILIMKNCSRPAEQKEAERKAQYEMADAINKADKKEAQARQDSIGKFYIDSIAKINVLVKTQNSKIKALQTKATNQRPKVIEKIQADTAVLSYVNTLEEIVTEQQVQIDTLKSVVEFHAKVNQDLIAMENIEDKIEASMQIESTRRIADLEQQGRRKERGKKGWKVLAVLGTVLGIVGGSQL